MTFSRIMPCLLKKDFSLVKTINYENPKYIGDPINTIQIFNNYEVDELIFLDIEATIKKRKPDFNLIYKIASECFIPLTYGGGVREIEDMKKIFNLGVEKIVICTYAIENKFFIQEASHLFGSQSIVVSVDVKKNNFGKYEVFTHSGDEPTGIDPIPYCKEIEKNGAGEILLNSIDRDGTMKGYDIDLIKKVCDSVSIPVIACGGAGDIQDIILVIKETGASVAAGSLFVYQGRNRSVLINFPSREDIIL